MLDPENSSVPLTMQIRPADLLARFEAAMKQRQREYMKGWAYSNISTEEWNGRDAASESMSETAVEVLQRLLETE